MLMVCFKKIEDTGVSCHIGNGLTCAITYADDNSLFVTCKSALAIMVKVCESYATEFDVIHVK